MLCETIDAALLVGSNTEQWRPRVNLTWTSLVTEL